MISLFSLVLPLKIKKQQIIGNYVVMSISDQAYYTTIYIS